MWMLGATDPPRTCFKSDQGAYRTRRVSVLSAAVRLRVRVHGCVLWIYNWRLPRTSQSGLSVNVMSHHRRYIPRPASRRSVLDARFSTLEFELPDERPRRRRLIRCPIRLTGWTLPRERPSWIIHEASSLLALWLFLTSSPRITCPLINGLHLSRIRHLQPQPAESQPRLRRSLQRARSV